MADGERIVSTCGRRLQVQATRRIEWTPTRRKDFLDHLAATCNVVQSAAAVGLSDDAAYALRRRDPGFAVEWSAALAAGYELLEGKLLARALAQRDPAEIGGDPSAIDTGPFDPAEARLLLQQARAAARTGGGGGGRRSPVKHATIEEVREALMVKMVALRKRIAKAGA